MLCPVCHKTTSAEYQFCLQCGADLGPVTLVNPSPSYEPPQTRSATDIVGFTALVLGCIALVVATYLYTRSGQSSPAPVASASPIVRSTSRPTPIPSATAQPATPDLSEPGYVQLPSGTQYKDFTIGTGAQPSPVSTVTIVYTSLLTDGRIIANSRQPEQIQLGVGKVMPALEEALTTMRVGGTRRIIIAPDHWQYGASGRPSDVAANASLVLEVQLLEVR